MAIVSKRKPQAWKTYIYGVQGIGKTTLGIQADDSLLLDIEKGSRLLGDVRRIDEETNPLETSDQIKEALREGYADEETKTIVIDSSTAMNKIFENEVLREMRIPSLAHNYGSGYGPMRVKWQEFLEITTHIAIKGGKNIILIGHNQNIKEHDSLLGVEVKKEIPHVDKNAFKEIVADFDGVFFFGFEKMLDEKKNIARGTGRRVLTTTGADDLYVAKSRFSGLEKRVIFDEGDFKKMNDFWKGLSNVQRTE